MEYFACLVFILDNGGRKFFYVRNFLNLQYADIDKQPRLLALSIIRTILPGHSDEIKHRENETGEIFYAINFRIYGSYKQGTRRTLRITDVPCSDNPVFSLRRRSITS